MLKELATFGLAPEQFDGLVKSLTVIAGLGTFITIAIRTRNLQSFASIWAGALAGAGIVTGGAIVFCAFVKSYIPVLADMQLYLGISGVSLIYLSLSSIVDAWKKGAAPAQPPAPPALSPNPPVPAQGSPARPPNP